MTDPDVEKALEAAGMLLRIAKMYRPDAVSASYGETAEGIWRLEMRTREPKVYAWNWPRPATGDQLLFALNTFRGVGQEARRAG